MTAQTVTTQVRLLKFGDVWNGPNGPETVTGIATSFRPTDYDVTLTNPALNTTRTVALNQGAWFAVTRDI